MYVLGRDTGSDDGTGSAGTNGEIGDERLPTVQLGSFLARDGSAGAAVGIDADSPHAGVVFGKRGTGKSYTLGVLCGGARGGQRRRAGCGRSNGRLRRASGDWRTGRRTTGPPSGDSPEAWPDLLGLDPASGPGSLVWRVVADALKSPEAGVRVNRTNRRRSRRSAIESTPQTRPLQIAARPQTTCGSRSRGACSTRTHRRPSGSSVAGSRPYSIRRRSGGSRGCSRQGGRSRALRRPDRRRPRSAPVAPRRRGARFLRRRR